MKIAGYVSWPVCVIAVAALSSMLVVALQDPSGLRDGGRELGLFFFVLVPAFWLAQAQVDGWLVDRHIAAQGDATRPIDGAASVPAEPFSKDRILRRFVWLD